MTRLVIDYVISFAFSPIVLSVRFDGKYTIAAIVTLLYADPHAIIYRLTIDL